MRGTIAPGLSDTPRMTDPGHAPIDDIAEARGEGFASLRFDAVEFMQFVEGEGLTEAEALELL